MKKYYPILLLFIISSALFLSCTKKYNPLKEKTKYIVFSNAYFWGESTNNAILITDTISISSLNKLYDNDVKYLYKSGFDYQIHFYDENHHHLYTRTINSESDEYSQNNDEIKLVINNLANAIKQHPTQYVYNLKVNKELESDSIIGILKKAGFDSFLLSDQREQYPQLKIVYCDPNAVPQKLNIAEKYFRHIIQNVDFEIQPIDTSCLHSSTTDATKYVNFTTNKISQMFYFPTNTDLDIIIKKIDEMNIEYLLAESCPKYYFIQLLSKDNIEETKARMERYTFIENISEATNGFVYKKCNLSE